MHNEKSQFLESQPLLRLVLQELKEFRSPVIYGVPILTNAVIPNGFISQELQYSNVNNTLLVHEFGLLTKPLSSVVKPIFKAEHLGTMQFLRQYAWMYNDELSMTRYVFIDSVTGRRSSSKMLESDLTYNTIGGKEVNEVLTHKLQSILQILRNQSQF
jgi:hypothetical protein